MESSITGTANLGEIASPKKEYKVGDTIKLLNVGFSLCEFNENRNLFNGQQIFEVEIKSIKTAKVVLE